MNVWNDVSNVLEPICRKAAQDHQRQVEKLSEEREKAKSEIVLLESRLQQSERTVRLLQSAADDTAIRAAEALAALASMNPVAFNAGAMGFDVQETYLRSRGWQRVPSGFIPPTGGGALPTATALGIAIGKDLQAVLPAVRSRLESASSKAIRDVA